MKGGKGKKVCFSMLFPWRGEVRLTVALGPMRFDASTGRDCVWRFHVAASRTWKIAFWRSIGTYPPWQHLRKRGKITVHVIDFVMLWAGMGGEFQHLRRPPNICNEISG